MLKLIMTTALIVLQPQTTEAKVHQYNNYVERLVNHYSNETNHNNKQLTCLAKNIYYESRGEPLTGQLAVANVTVNRKKNNNSTICIEVYKPNQFSWTGKRLNQPSGDEWYKAQAIAFIVLNKPALVNDLTKGATYFHSGSKPYDFKHFKHTVTIGNHKFYRE